MSSGNIPEKPVLRCVNCGAIISADGLVWQVRRFDRELNDFIYCPCCSQGCAQEIQVKDTTRLEDILDMLRKQSFQIMSPKDYLGQ